MTIDKDKFRDFTLWLIDLLYRERTELVAYQAAHLLLAAAGLSQEFDRLLEQSRKHPGTLLPADHQAARNTIEQLLSEEKVDAALEFLKKWKPTGPMQ